MKGKSSTSLKKRIFRLLTILLIGIASLYLVIYVAAWATVNPENPLADLIVYGVIALIVIFVVFKYFKFWHILKKLF